MQNIYLLRSPEALIERDRAGYGWNQVNFSEYSGQPEDIFLQAFVKQNFDLGRQQSQILRFFNIQAGDLIVVPVYGAIVIGIAGTERFYDEHMEYGGNQLYVSYLRDKENNIVRIPRESLQESLQARLKIRMTIVSLNEFSEDIMHLVQQITKGGAIGISEQYAQANKIATDNFKSALLENIRSGKTWLKSGGLGLEALVQELMTLEGYQAKILTKNNSEGIGDIDIEATKNDRLTQVNWQIQVKHHYGISDNYGIEQLLALAPRENTSKCFITTAKLDPETKTAAEAQGIAIIEGEELVDWIFERWSLLSSPTKIALGAVDIPQLILNI